MIQHYIDDNYTYTKLDSITVNPNAVTDADGDYITFIYLTWNQKNKGETLKKMLTM